jgi:hypothetical protein
MKWSGFYPSNHALRDLNKRQQRRAWRRKIRVFLRRVSPRVHLARYDVEPQDCYGVVVPRPQPRPHNEFWLILQQRAFFEPDFDEDAA